MGVQSFSHLICSYVEHLDVRFPVRAHALDASTACEYATLFQLLQPLNVCFSASRSAREMLEDMRWPLDLGPAGSAFRDAFEHYSLYFEPASSANTANQASSRERFSESRSCCVTYRAAGSAAPPDPWIPLLPASAHASRVVTKWYTRAEKALLIVMSCFVGDRLSMLRHDSPQLKSFPARVRTWLVSNDVTSGGSKRSFVRARTKLEQKRHEVLGDVLDPSFLESLGPMPQSPLPPSVEQKKMHTNLVKPHKRLPHLRYMFEHYNTGESSNETPPLYYGSRHSTLVGPVLEVKNNERRHRNSVSRCIDLNHHLQTGEASDIAEHFPNHASMMLQVIKHIPTESRLVHQVKETQLVFESKREFECPLMMHSTSWCTAEQFCELLAYSCDYKLLSEMDLHLFHTRAPSSDKRETQREYVFALVHNQVAVRVQAWLRIVCEQLDLDLGSKRWWCADIAAASDRMHTALVIERSVLLLVQRMSVSALVSTERLKTCVFAHSCAPGAFPRILVQTCHTHGVNTGLRVALQLVRGELRSAQNSSLLESHSRVVSRVCTFLFHLRYTDVDTNAKHVCAWFFSGGLAQSADFGTFQHLMLVLLLMPFVKCSVSASRHEIVFALMRGDRLKPIKNEKSVYKRMQMAAAHSAELRQQCTRSEGSRIEFSDSPRDRKDEMLAANERDAVMVHMSRLVDVLDDDSHLYHPDALFALLSCVTLHLPCSQAYFDSIVARQPEPHRVRSAADDRLAKAPLYCSQHAQSQSSNQETLAFAYALQALHDRDIDEATSHAHELLSDSADGCSLWVDDMCAHTHLALPRFSHLDESIDPHMMSLLMQVAESEAHQGRSRLSEHCPLYSSRSLANSPIAGAASDCKPKPVLPSLSLARLSSASHSSRKRTSPAAASDRFAARPRRPSCSSVQYSPSAMSPVREYPSTDSSEEEPATQRVSNMSPRLNPKRHRASSTLADFR